MADTYRKRARILTRFSGAAYEKADKSEIYLHLV